ncbi:hypothetical protein [Actinomadura nitritigenes]|uniref:hypothetical protein n=1 Tax=Actinomadura nitritigenes TaxID=134602 RepID=UPI003D907660
MSGRTAPFPPLPAPLELRLNVPAWRYPSRCAAGHGVGQLRIWSCRVADRLGHLAIVTECGIGATTTNSAEPIWGILRRSFMGPLVLLEHWPQAQSPDVGEHLDQVVVACGLETWRAIWPTPPTNPAHLEFEAWMAVHGRELLDTDENPATPFPWGPHCDHRRCDRMFCRRTGRAERPCHFQPLGCPLCTPREGPGLTVGAF